MIFTEWQIDMPVHEAIFQALGAASVCWSTPEGAGVFDSERAKAIGEELIALLQRKLWVTNEPNPDLAFWAWTIIANVSQGNWSEQPPEWVEAAECWRDAFHAALDDVPAEATP